MYTSILFYHPTVSTHVLVLTFPHVGLCTHCIFLFACIYPPLCIYSFTTICSCVHIYSSIHWCLPIYPFLRFHQMFIYVLSICTDLSPCTNYSSLCIHQQTTYLYVIFCYIHYFIYNSAHPYVLIPSLAVNPYFSTHVFAPSSMYSSACTNSFTYLPIHW